MTPSTWPHRSGLRTILHVLERFSQSPDLNLIEHLSRDLKIAVQSPFDLTELERNCREIHTSRCARLVALVSFCFFFAWSVIQYGLYFLSDIISRSDPDEWQVERFLWCGVVHICKGNYLWQENKCNLPINIVCQYGKKIEVRHYFWSQLHIIQYIWFWVCDMSMWGFNSASYWGSWSSMENSKM